MRLNQKAVLLITKTKTGKKLVSKQRYRIILSAVLAFMFNLLYAIYLFVLGVLNVSFWVIAMCAFYGILASARFSAILCEHNHSQLPSVDTELFVMNLRHIAGHIEYRTCCGQLHQPFAEYRHKTW